MFVSCLSSFYDSEFHENRNFLFFCFFLTLGYHIYWGISKCLLNNVVEEQWGIEVHFPRVPKTMWEWREPKLNSMVRGLSRSTLSCKACCICVILTFWNRDLPCTSWYNVTREKRYGCHTGLLDQFSLLTWGEIGQGTW